MKTSDGSLITYQDLQEACRRVLKSRKEKLLPCRHKKVSKSCKMRGTKDGKKAPCIRRSHLEAELKISSSSDSKSHLRAYHVAWIASAPPDDIEKIHSQPAAYEVRHLCGHGLGQDGGCDEESHLKLGSVLQNEEDKHFHFVLDKCKDPEMVLALLKEQIPDIDIM